MEVLIDWLSKKEWDMPRQSPCVKASHALLLADIRAFDKSRLRETPTVVTNVLGEKWVEYPGREVLRQVSELEKREEETRLKIHAARKAALLRSLSGRDVMPSKGVMGLPLFVGSSGAARNVKGLRKRGVTHVVNASAIVPCYFMNNPNGAFSYLKIPIFDDGSVDIVSYFEEVHAFMEQGLSGHGGVLVHCCAGHSRSVAFVMSYLMWKKGLDVDEALRAVQEVRPSAMPNEGFMNQLAVYGAELESRRL